MYVSSWFCRDLQEEYHPKYSLFTLYISEFIKLNVSAFFRFPPTINHSANLPNIPSDKPLNFYALSSDISSDSLCWHILRQNNGS